MTGGATRMKVRTIVAGALVGLTAGATLVTTAGAGPLRRTPAQAEQQRFDESTLVDVVGPDGKVTGQVRLFLTPPPPSELAERAARAPERPYRVDEDGSVVVEVVPFRPEPGGDIRR
jgi:hypothetical protein